MRPLTFALVVLLATLSQHAQAQIDESRVTAALDDLAQIARAGDASPLFEHLACLDHTTDEEGGSVAPCVYEGDPRMEDTAGALMTGINAALPPEASWTPDAITTRTREGHALTEVVVKVRRDGDLVGLSAFLFADHASRPLLVQIGDGPSMLLAEAAPPEAPSMLDLPILQAPDLNVQLPARAALLQRAIDGELSTADTATLLFCRTYPGGGRGPAPCSPADAAERVPQVLAELAFALGDAQITPRTESIVVPHEVEGVPGAQVQFEVEGRRPTLFFIEDQGTYLYVSAHPDMDPLTLPIPDAQPRLEALLADLLDWTRTGNAEAAAPHIVFRGDGPDRWQRALDPANADDLARAEGALQQLARMIGTYVTYTVTSYLTDTESEGTWHALETEFESMEILGETETVTFAFLFIDDVFVLGDVD
ncbi:MAG: hypothetical protein AAFP18_14190 [Bacteroidota bacterium]